MKKCLRDALLKYQQEFPDKSQDEFLKESQQTSGGITGEMHKKNVLGKSQDFLKESTKISERLLAEIFRKMPTEIAERIAANITGEIPPQNP